MVGKIEARTIRRVARALALAPSAIGWRHKGSVDLLFGGQEMARVLFAILLGVVVAACEGLGFGPGTEPVAESIPESRTTEWAGVISRAGCDSYTIEITIDENGGIFGIAKHHAAGTLWNVSGVFLSRSIHIVIEAPAQRYVPTLTLVGRLIGSGIQIAEPTSLDCVPGRSGILERVVLG